MDFVFTFEFLMSLAVFVISVSAVSKCQILTGSPLGFICQSKLIYIHIMYVNEYVILLNTYLYTKGQLISKANSKLFIWTKKPMKIFSL